MSPKKRLTMRLKHPNPLFEKWLTEWKEEAKAKGSKSHCCISEALLSLRKYPLPLETGRHCKILKGFGDKLCSMLDEKLKKHQQDELGNVTVKKPPDISELINSDIIEEENIIVPKKTKLTQKSSSTELIETIILEPTTFDIILLVDTAETSGVKQAQHDPIVSDLLRLGTNFEIRHLKVGDYVWICRRRGTKSEFVLPYIIERKRMDDFGQSIKDGRYHEQKFRLNQCGIQNVVYLVESHGTNAHVGLPMTTLMQAATNTMVHDGFQVKFSDNSRSTAHYLNTMSKVITRIFSDKKITSCPRDNLNLINYEDDVVSAVTFLEFSKIGSRHKKFTVKEMFIRHLLQLKGLSVDKALAIVKSYPTPRALMESYRNNPESAEKLLSNLIFGKGNKTIGPAVSKVVYQLLEYGTFSIGAIYETVTKLYTFIKQYI